MQSSCGVCHDFTANPIILHCLHKFCSNCLLPWTRENQQLENRVPCPICDAQTLISWDFNNETEPFLNEEAEEESDDPTEQWSFENLTMRDHSPPGRRTDESDYNDYVFSDTEDFDFLEDESRRTVTNIPQYRLPHEARTRRPTYEPDYRDYTFSESEDDHSGEYMTGARPLSTSPR